MTATATQHLLLEVQDLDQSLQRLRAERERGPREVQAAERAVREAEASCQERAAAIQKERTAVHGAEVELKAVEEKLHKLEAQLNSVKTNREYSALLTEISSLKREDGGLEEKILEGLDRIEALDAEHTKAKGALAEREADLEGVRRRVAAEQARLDGRIAEVREKRAALARELPEPLLRRYERVFGAKRGLAIVPVEIESDEHAICGGCNMAVRPDDLADLRAGSEMSCRSCVRLLYIP